MRICQFIDIFQKGKNLSVVLQKTYNRFIQTSKLLVRFITTRIMRATAVKNIPTSIPAGVFGNTFLERKTENTNHKRTFSVIAAECGRSVFGASHIRIILRNFISISSLNGLLGFWSKLRKLYQTGKYLTQIRIGTAAIL